MRKNIGKCGKVFYMNKILPIKKKYLCDSVNYKTLITSIRFAAVCFNKPGKALRYANEAVYPFYILHQTVIIILGYYIKDQDWGLLPKFAILSFGTFFLSWLLYEFGIRRYRFIRPLFGMKKAIRPKTWKNE